MSGKAKQGDDKDVREAALCDPSSVFRDFPVDSTAVRALQSMMSPAPAPAEAEALYSRGEKKRAGGGLTKDMIKRIADRAEQAAKAKRG